MVGWTTPSAIAAPDTSDAAPKVRTRPSLSCARRSSARGPPGLKTTSLTRAPKSPGVPPSSGTPARRRATRSATSGAFRVAGNGRTRQAAVALQQRAVDEPVGDVRDAEHAGARAGEVVQQRTRGRRCSRACCCPAPVWAVERDRLDFVDDEQWANAGSSQWASSAQKSARSRSAPHRPTWTDSH